MSQIMKAFTGVFFILLMMMSSVGLLSGFLQVVQAQNYHRVIIDELENSDYAKSVLQESFLVAEEAGFELAVTLYYENEGVVKCANLTDIPENCTGVYMAEVELGFPFQIAFLEVDTRQRLFGYAR